MSNGNKKKPENMTWGESILSFFYAKKNQDQHNPTENEKKEVEFPPETPASSDLPPDVRDQAHEALQTYQHPVGGDTSSAKNKPKLK